MIFSIATLSFREGGVIIPISQRHVRNELCVLFEVAENFSKAFFKK